jgi:hypothetical protein
VLKYLTSDPCNEAVPFDGEEVTSDSHGATGAAPREEIIDVTGM